MTTGFAGYELITEAIAANAGKSLSRPDFSSIEARALTRLPALRRVQLGLGGTPLVPVAAGRGRVWLKLEGTNTTGTVKARTAYALLCNAVAAGEGDPAGLRLVEYTGGGMGLALAEYCAELGLDLHLVFPHGSAVSGHERARSLGADVTVAAPGSGFLGAMEAAARIAEAEDRTFLLQHCAPVAAAMHEERTGAEIARGLAAAGAAPTAVVAACGTGGTLLGVTRALRLAWPDVKPVAVFPAEAPYGGEAPPTPAKRMGGTGGLGYGIRQPLLVGDDHEINFRVVSYPRALAAMTELRRQTDLAACSSGAAAWRVAAELAARGGGDVVAVVAARGTVEEWDDAHA